MSSFEGNLLFYPARVSRFFPEYFQGVLAGVGAAYGSQVQFILGTADTWTAAYMTFSGPALPIGSQESDIDTNPVGDVIFAIPIGYHFNLWLWKTLAFSLS